MLGAKDDDLKVLRHLEPQGCPDAIECDHCGRSCDSVYAEDYVYCPYCGRLNMAREVEVGE